MHWLDAHTGTVIAATGVAVVFALLLLASMLGRSAAQAHRAVLGAALVPLAAEFVTAPDGGLGVVVPIANAAPRPAWDLTVQARIGGTPVAEGVRGVALLGSLDGTPHGGALVRPAFTWPVGVLEAGIDVRWRWRDGAGRHRARWTTTLRVPEQAFPESGATS